MNEGVNKPIQLLELFGGIGAPKIFTDYSETASLCQ